MDNSDVIVIGGGMGGLVSAGLLASKGFSVLVLEKEPKIGGYVTGFDRNGFYFDATGAFIAACRPGGEFYQILQELNISDQLTFLPIGKIWNIYPDLELRVYYDNPGEYIGEIKRLFPVHAQALEAYSLLTTKLGKEFIEFESAPLWKKIFLPFSFPTLFRNARKCHADILHAYFGRDNRIHMALSALPTTLPPSKLSYAFVAVLWAKVLADGVYYPKGGMLALTNALASAITDNDGKIECEKTVDKIIIKGKRATGVVLSDGTAIHSKWVIGGMNLFKAKQMLPDNKPLYGKMHRIGRYSSSLSAVLFYVALPSGCLPDNWPYFISIHTSSDPEAEHRILEEGNMGKENYLVITTPTVLDPSLAPEGQHSLKVLVHAPRADHFQKMYGTGVDMDRLKNNIFLTIKNRTGLDIHSNALFVDQATPVTLMDRTGNENGAMYGLDAACEQVGPLRPPNRTALDNLLWVGHYTRPSHGIVGSAMAGKFAANIIQSTDKN
ncbi:MAG: NAD(P)/FAD-dependent oxidoreductase [Deltaproteobacteria bacterium]|nr:NAD(P)/FAD-dependent oxidoreductase [Deltaproteobacteria bacterium]